MFMIKLNYLNTFLSHISAFALCADDMTDRWFVLYIKEALRAVVLSF